MRKEHIFFCPGEICQIKQDIPNRPTMVVKRIVKARLPELSKTASSKEQLDHEKKNKNAFLGVKCFWFTASGEYQEELFNSKDLEKC